MQEVSLWPLGEQAIRDIKRIADKHSIGIESARDLYWAFGKEDRWIQCALAVGVEHTRRLRTEVKLHLDPEKLAERIRELQEHPTRLSIPF